MDRKYIPIIKIIQELGFSVVYIDNTFFVVSDFIPADDQIDVHTVTGIDVTELVQNHTSVIVMDKQLSKKTEELITSMLKTITETNKFSRDHSWRWFYNTGLKKNVV